MSSRSNPEGTLKVLTPARGMYWGPGAREDCYRAIHPNPASGEVRMGGEALARDIGRGNIIGGELPDVPVARGRNPKSWAGSLQAPTEDNCLNPNKSNWGSSGT